MRLIEAIKYLVMMARRGGNPPVEIHVSRKTLNELTAYVRDNTPPTKDTRSPLHRLLRVPAPTATPGPVLVLGLPVIENSACADDFCALRLPADMNDPEWLDTRRAEIESCRQAASRAHVSDGETPWLKPVNVDDDPSEDDPIRIESLYQRSGMPSPSDVLMASFDQVEKVRDVIVLRVRENHDVEMCASMPKTAAVGYLQKVLSRISLE